MNRNRWLVMGAVTLLPFAAGAVIWQAPVVKTVQEGAQLFAQVLAHVRQNAVDSVSASDLYEKAARGLVNSLNDPYAELYSPTELASFQRNTLGNNYGGVGMQIESQDGWITVSRVFPGTPGEQAGILAGDRILRVDSTDVTGFPLDQVSGRMTGRAGTQVDVLFGRPGVPDPIPVTFTRAIIRVPAVPYAVMLDGEIGYIPLQRFNESAAQDIATAVQDLRRQGARSLVLDLRGNPGGSLEQSLQIGDLFIEPGLEIASVRHRGKTPEMYYARMRPIMDSTAMVVLVDGFSASASEIVAGTLQDHDRALVLGTPSFGKGLVQTLFPLDGGWALKLTTGKWYTPSGRSIQGEHKQLDDGRFVEYAPDTAESDSAKRQRPVFHSDAGRVIYGGGGVTPDIIVKPDTTTKAERAFLQAIAPQSQQMYIAIYNVAREAKGSVKSTFVVDQPLREQLWRSMLEQKIVVDRKLFDGATSFVDRNLEQRIASLAFGDSSAFRRSLSRDAQMREAMALLKQRLSQRDLLALADRRSTEAP